MNDLKEKKILLIATAFFGYELKIKHALERLGAEVVFYDERSIKKQWEKALIRLSPSIFKRKTEKYYENIIKNCKNTEFDVICFYGATMIDESILKIVKSSIKNKRIIAYFADTVRGSSRLLKMFPYFDKIATYDRKDFHLYKENYPQFAYLPLFYSDEYKNDEIIQQEPVFDLCFIGTIHSDRLQFLDAIKVQAESLGLKVFFYSYLQSGFMFYFYLLTNKLFWKKKKTDFMYEKISANEVNNIIKKSRCVVDAQYPKNIGLTMRTLETLGMKRKLITTNADIVNYDFYNTTDFLIVDRVKPVIDYDFIMKAYKPIPSDIYDKYFIDNWAKQLFS